MYLHSVRILPHLTEVNILDQKGCRGILFDSQLISIRFIKPFITMTKLYYTPTSCGAASFIAAVAAGIHIDTEVVDIGTHKTASGEDYYKINPKGNVPGLVLDDGTVLNEGSAVLQWIADQVSYIDHSIIKIHSLTMY